MLAWKDTNTEYRYVGLMMLSVLFVSMGLFQRPHPDKVEA